ncbi:long-chain fatty acid transport protein 4-like [Mercenaria mercenaria]|uniref:long-chain fatty acid transport protein 4-like n=1 Tax=Mercenaria mercenaria TaxID=6596 RepID=UPI00234EE948|nr:long-chain fatty acid transport protein 4-like [Mercenaria mercenaria]
MTTAFSVARYIRTVVDLVCNMWALKLVSFFMLGVFFSYYLGLSCLLTTLAVFGVYLATGGWRFMKVVIKTLPRDLRALSVLLTLKWNVKKYNNTGSSIPKLFQATVEKFPNKTCFIYEDKRYTFQEVDLLTNSIANYFYESGIRQGNVFAILMENRPEVVFYWLGLAKIGAVGALINHNLRDKSLLHCIHAAEAHGIVFSQELSPAVQDIAKDLPNTVQLYYIGQGSVSGVSAISLDPLLDKSPTYQPPAPKTRFTDKLFYVYTSGTTGLPKAAIISHSRFYYMSYAVNLFLEIGSDDILYNALPLYHTAGGIIGVGQAFLRGTTVVIKKKFSASKFWDDCVQYKCTAAQYIGEICRYLMAQPFRSSETQHKVRVMFGNGLQPGLWRDFQKRFGVKIMGEFYGATEGNCNILNFTNHIGACGFTSMIAPFMYPVTLVKVDEENNIVRDRNGVCVKAKPGEPGELVGRIVLGDPLRQFDGYVCKKASDKKVAKDVFRKGDMAFLTGDVLVMDEYGYMHFRDRTGDTFRWRGENVSTFEVETTISKVIKLNDAVVYGVAVPGSEGRAGMAAIVDPNDQIDLKELAMALQKSLPSYTRPLFIRLMRQAADTTGTHKLKKTTLQAEGFNPNIVKDRLFYMNTKTGQYESLTQQVYDDICNQKIRM